ncbi:threonine/serine exporter family protein [Curtobacterium sp. MCJR17_043]|uniref:threonine/serine exporter family protein n=1 Tax=Curtobacterium sp. MCJR17_043 TaxID=2175660 RepID=UPI0024DFB83C|nr:threonine/serine exporter family protein [Curtobacterium sp. MCJR17_043]WIB36237.1 threonine/serine exporter family protein [Curtobacterium sp. MCJR17_043]
MVSAGANCFVQQASARVIPVAVVLSVAAGAALWQLKAFGLPLLGATFLASVLLGVLSTYAAVRMRTAVAAIAVPAFCGALLPGVAVSNALLNVMSGSSSSVLDFGSAVTVALAIGAGLVLGGLFATPGGTSRPASRPPHPCALGAQRHHRAAGHPRLRLRPRERVRPAMVTRPTPAPAAAHTARRSH